MNFIIKSDLQNTILIKNLGNLSLIVKSDLQNTIFEKNLQTFKLDHKMPSSKYNLDKKSKKFFTWSLILIFKIQYSWKIRKFLNLIIKSDLQDTIRKFFNLITLHSLTGKYRFFTGISLWSISTATCFGCVQGLKGQISLKCKEIFEFYTGISISYLHSCLCFYNRDFPVLWKTTTWKLLKQGKPCILARKKLLINQGNDVTNTV